MAALLAAGCSDGSKRRPGSGDGGDADGGLDGSTCGAPTHMLVRLLDDDASLSPGWSGFSHRLSLPETAAYAVEVTGCDDTCTLCRFRGPVNHEGLPLNPLRCADDTRVTCTSDADCGEDDECRHFIGPTSNAAVSIGAGLDVCVSVFFEPLAEAILNGSEPDTAAIQGYADLSTGQMTLTSFNIGTSQVLGVCRQCDGDTTTLDGERDGTCSGDGPDITCDSQGSVAKASLDCMPAGPSLGAFTLQFGPMATTSFEWELSESSPDCGLEPGKKCWCGVCEDPDGGAPCRQDSDCPSGSCGPTENSRTDACGTWTEEDGFTDTDCTVVDEDRNIGSCTAVLPGTETETGQEAADVSCFGGAGALGTSLRAYGEPSEYEGGVSRPTLAGIACMPSTGNAGTDEVSGLPGVGAFEVGFEVTLVGE